MSVNSLTKADVFYFGCGLRAGHFLHHPGMQKTTWKPMTKKMWPDIPWLSIDGTLCPEGTQVQGLGSIHHLDGWTAWAFWDRSVDTRPGSNSVFFAHGTYDFEAMKAIAGRFFPQVWERYGFSFSI